MSNVRDITPEDAEKLTALYQDYEWWTDRDTADIRTAVAETEVAVGIEDNSELVAAGRILTDFIYYATVFDVIVAADRRGRGLEGN